MKPEVLLNSSSQGLVGTIVHQIQNGGQQFVKIVTKSETECKVLLRISFEDEVHLQSKRWLCPNACTPIPEISIPLYILLLQPLGSKKVTDLALSCSLTIHQALQHFRMITMRKAKLVRWAWFLVQLLAERQVQECSEQWALYGFEHGLSIHDVNLLIPRRQSHHDQSVAHGHGLSYKRRINEGKSNFHTERRKVQAVVIWIGSVERYKRMEKQHVSLASSPFHNTSAVIGWAATDRLYTCRMNSTRCLSSNKKYGGVLPKSDVNYMSTGWGCAQRRPLRALAHVLLLFDPDYMILLDDDTYLNFPLLQSRFGLLINSTLRTESAYLGEAMGKTGDMGHVSKLGFFVGGAGYILGKELLNRLVHREVAAFGYEELLLSNLRLTYAAGKELIRSDDYRSSEQIWHLSLLGEGLQEAQRHCPDHLSDQELPTTQPDVHSNYDSCIRIKKFTLENAKKKNSNQTIDHDNAVVGIGSRLVDFCVNLMANEHTCQHRCSTYYILLCSSADADYRLDAVAIIPWGAVWFMEHERDLCR